METIIAKPTQPWWLLHLHDASYVLMGVVLLVHPGRDTGLLGGLLLLAGLSAGLAGSQHSAQHYKPWYVLSALLDCLFGLALLTQMGSPPETMINSLALWALIYAFLYCIEAMFYLRGKRSSGSKDYWVEVIHFFCILLAVGIGFGLTMGPNEQPASPGFAGLFLMGLGLMQVILTWRVGHRPG